MIGRKQSAGLHAKGAASLAEVSPGDRVFVLCLRRWLDGPCGQAEIWNGLARTHGAWQARQFLTAFERLLREIAGSAGRLLDRHATPCPCLGADEALLAGMVRAAGRGDSDTASALAAGIVRETDLAAVVAAAARLGRLLDDLNDNLSSDAVTSPATRPVTGVRSMRMN